MGDNTIPFNLIDYDIYCVTVPILAGRNPAFSTLQESIWRDSNDGDLWYRIDSARSEMHILRHVHIAHRKQLSAPAKQVAWNDDQTRHDRHNFDASFSPMEKAKALAKQVLRLPDDALLEAVELADVYTSYVLTEAAAKAGVSYTGNNLFFLRLP